MDQEGDTGREWIPLGEFARRLGIARASVYGRIKRGTLEFQRANKGGYLVQWPPPANDGSGNVALQSRDVADNRSDNSSATVVGLPPELRARLDAAERERDELRIALAKAQATLEAVTTLAQGEVAAAKRVAAAEIAAMRDQLETGVAARNAVIEATREALIRVEANASRLAAELAEARKPLLVRLVEAMRRR